MRGEGVTLSVDPRSNTLIFFTTGAKYQTLLPMVQRLDVPPKQILLETMIAEVTLTGEFAYGVEFAFTSGNFSGGTLGGLGLPSGGLQLNWINSLTQQARIKLSASNNLVNILSNPTLVVRDGVEASIKVGNDVPTVGATATDPLQSDTQITQVLYRKTGLDLKIRPTINAEGVVVMEISQSISNTVEGASDVQGAPVFFERAVTTEVVARSGESILLAGLISERKNDNSSYVPGLGQIPGRRLAVPVRQQGQGTHRARGPDHAARDRGPQGMERDPDRNARGAAESRAAGAECLGVRSWRRYNACGAAAATRGAALRRAPGAGLELKRAQQTIPQVGAGSRFLLLTSNISGLNFRFELAWNEPV